MSGKYTEQQLRELSEDELAELVMQDLTEDELAAIEGDPVDGIINLLRGKGLIIAPPRIETRDEVIARIEGTPTDELKRQAATLGVSANVIGLKARVKNALLQSMGYAPVVAAPVAATAAPPVAAAATPASSTAAVAAAAVGAAVAAAAASQSAAACAMPVASRASSAASGSGDEFILSETGSTASSGVSSKGKSCETILGNEAVCNASEFKEIKACAAPLGIQGDTKRELCQNARGVAKMVPRYLPPAEYDEAKKLRFLWLTRLSVAHLKAQINAINEELDKRAATDPGVKEFKINTAWTTQTKSEELAKRIIDRETAFVESGRRIKIRKPDNTIITLDGFLVRPESSGDKLFLSPYGNLEARRAAMEKRGSLGEMPYLSLSAPSSAAATAIRPPVLSATGAAGASAALVLAAARAKAAAEGAAAAAAAKGSTAPLPPRLQATLEDLVTNPACGTIGKDPARLDDLVAYLEKTGRKTDEQKREFLNKQLQAIAVKLGLSRVPAIPPELLNRDIVRYYCAVLQGKKDQANCDVDNPCANENEDCFLDIGKCIPKGSLSSISYKGKRFVGSRESMKIVEDMLAAAGAEEELGVEDDALGVDDDAAELAALGGDFGAGAVAAPLPPPRNMGAAAAAAAVAAGESAKARPEEGTTIPKLSTILSTKDSGKLSSLQQRVIDCLKLTTNKPVA